MVRTGGKLQQTIVLAVGTLLLFGMWWKLSAVQNCLYETDKRKTTGGNVHITMEKMFPIDSVKNKVDLSLGILCQPDEWFVDDVIRSVHSVTQQVDEDTEIRTYVVFVGILSTKADEIQQVQDRFHKSSLLKDVAITFVKADKQLLQQRLDNRDTFPAFFRESKELVELKCHMNILLAMLYWHAAQTSRYYLLTDSRFTLNGGALSKLIKEYEAKGGSSKLFRIKDQKVDGIFGALYGSGKMLAALGEFMYWLSPYQDSSTLLMYYEHLMQSHGSIDTEKPMFGVHQINVPGLIVEKNPVALTTTNMTVVEENFVSNPYDRGEMFWTSTALKGSFIIMKFTQLIQIQKIRIDTGKNIYFNDILTEAVLEEANEFNGDDCGAFKQIADFRSSKINVDVSKRNLKTACLRIKLIADQGHWIAIRLIQITTL